MVSAAWRALMICVHVCSHDLKAFIVKAFLGLPGAKEAAAVWRLHSVTAPKLPVVCLAAAVCALCRGPEVIHPSPAAARPE